MNHFQLNARINTIASNLPIDNSIPDLVLDILRAQVKLIRDEFNELKDGVAADVRKEVRDGIADVIVTVDGLLFRLGLEMHEPKLQPLSADARNGGHLQFLRRLDTLISALEYYRDGSHTAVDVNHIQTLCQALINNTRQFAELNYVDLDADQVEVYESNLSKFDTDMDEVGKTIRKYLDLGVETEIAEATIDGVTYYVVKSAYDQQGGDNKSYPKGKFLKSVNFREPNLGEAEALAAQDAIAAL